MKNKKELEEIENNFNNDNPEDSEIIINDKSELAQVFDSLDSDDFTKNKNISNIDFNSRLSQTEIHGCLQMDELQRMGLLPANLSLSRQKKRLAVSLDGKGRQEKVQIVVGERENRNGANAGIMSKFAGIFQKKE